MSNDSSTNENCPNYSALETFGQEVQKIEQLIPEIVASLQSFLQSMMDCLAIIEPKVKVEEAIAGFEKASRPLIVIEKLGDAQFVQWDYLSNEFVNAILSSNNVNRTLHELFVKNKFKSVDTTVEKCKANPYLHKYMRLFEQSVTSFRRGQNDLAVVGLTSIFDGLLSDISGNPTHQLKPRLEEIDSKLEKEEYLDNNEYAILALSITFSKAVKSFWLFSPFTQEEPKGLNRHWIAHGRSMRRKTKLDCIKLINLIYGLLLINELDIADELPKIF